MRRSLPRFVITRTRCFPQSIGEQHFGSDDFKAEASSFPGQKLHESVQTLGISGGVSIGEVVEDGITVVFNRQRERQEALVYIERDVLEPSKVTLQGNFFAWSFVDVVKRFLELVCGFQLRKVFEPCFNNQLLTFIQVMGTSQKQVAVVHQGPSLFVCQAFSYLPANVLQASREKFEDVELVYDQFCLWQYLAYSIAVARPHIGANDNDLLFHLGGQALQVTDNGCFLAVSKQVNNMVAVNISDDATILVQQVQLVNAQIELLGIWKTRLNGSRELAEQEADRPFCQSGIFSNAGEGSALRFRSNVVDQAQSHEMVLIHMGYRREEGAATSTTAVTLALNDDPNVFPSDRYVHIKLGLRFMPVELGVSAMGTARRRSDRLRLNVKIVFIFIYRNDAVVYQSQDIQRLFSLPEVLPHEFSSGREIPVTQERRLLRVSW